MQLRSGTTMPDNPEVPEATSSMENMQSNTEVRSTIDQNQQAQQSFAPQMPMPMNYNNMMYYPQNEQNQQMIMDFQRRQMELSMTQKPILRSLLPEDVTKFLIQFELHENTVRLTMGIQDPNIQHCLDIRIIPELATIGADLQDKESILQVLRNLRDQDHEARKQYITTRVKEDIEWVNRGNIPASMRSFIYAIDTMTMGIKLDNHTEKMLCRAIISNLPIEFTQGSPEETQSKKGWKNYSKMKKELIEEAQILSRFTMTSSKLKTGIHDKRSNRKSSRRSNYNQKRDDVVKIPVTQRNTSGADQIKAAVAAQSRHFTYRTPEEIERCKNNGLCYHCMMRGHLSRDCPTLAKKEYRQGSSSKIIKKGTNQFDYEVNN